MQIIYTTNILAANFTFYTCVESPQTVVSLIKTKIFESFEDGNWVKRSNKKELGKNTIVIPLLLYITVRMKPIVQYSSFRKVVTRLSWIFLGDKVFMDCGRQVLKP